MKQSASQPSSPSGLHVGIIMDGNGRWATRQGRSRSAGHREGAAVVRRIVEAAPDAGIGVLTLFAFSADNWSRPPTEVSWLMRLFREYLRVETARCKEKGVRLEIIGRRDRLADPLRRTMESAEHATAAGERLHLRIALDYSARDAILRAAQCLRPEPVPAHTVPGRLDVALGLAVLVQAFGVLALAGIVPRPARLYPLGLPLALLGIALIWRDSPTLFALNLLGVGVVAALASPWVRATG